MRRHIFTLAPQHAAAVRASAPKSQRIEVTHVPIDDGCLPFGVDVMQRGQIGGAAIDGHRIGGAVLVNRFVEEAPCGGVVRLARNRKSTVSPCLSTAR